MLALKRLVERFGEGEEVDDSMYDEIFWWFPSSNTPSQTEISDSMSNKSRWSLFMTSLREYVNLLVRFGRLILGPVTVHPFTLSGANEAQLTVDHQEEVLTTLTSHQQACNEPTSDEPLSESRGGWTAVLPCIISMDDLNHILHRSSPTPLSSPPRLPSKSPTGSLYLTS
jgi:hypothetical protein